MSRERRRRADKIVGARQRVVDLAQAELGAAAHRTAEAKGAADLAKGEWQARMGARALQECTSHDLALESAYVSTLEKRSEYLLRLAREAAAREDGARLKVQKAKTEHKKVETWRDRLVEADVLEEAAVERRAADDVAARIARRA
jgi:flagellar biosynthesis chaperone FliJ